MLSKLWSAGVDEMTLTQYLKIGAEGDDKNCKSETHSCYRSHHLTRQTGTSAFVLFKVTLKMSSIGKTSTEGNISRARMFSWILHTDRREGENKFT